MNKSSKASRNRIFPSRWLSRLDVVRQELRRAHWPRTAEDGMYQVLELSGQGWAQLIRDLKEEHPGESAHQLEDAAHRLIWSWDAARKTMTLSGLAKRI